MTRPTRLFWIRLALGLSGLTFALGVVVLMDSSFELRREYARHEFLEGEVDSVTYRLDSLTCLLSDTLESPHFLTLQFEGVSSGISSGVDWRAIIPQEARLLLLYDTLLQAGISSPEAARKVFRVYFDEDDLSAL